MHTQKPQIIYLVFCFLGFVLPYSQFVPFIIERGLNINLFVEQLFANKISGFFGMDVIVAVFILWAFIIGEGSRLKMKNLWIYIASSFLVGVSFGLPLFLLMRQRQLEQPTKVII